MTLKRAPERALPPGVSRVDEIDKRAEALRENLKKRKAQSSNAKAKQQDLETE